MRVPFLDLAKHHEPIAEQLQAAMAEVLTSNAYVLGPQVAQFEEEFSEFIGVPGSVGVASGLDALRLILRAWNIGRGDEVITAANTFIATTLAIDAVGATPVLVDCDPRTYNLDVEQLEAAINSKTKAIIPVHLYGQPAEMGAVMDIAGRHGLKVLEDASQAQGALYGDQRVGSIGDAAAVSLYPGKNLGAFGDAGIVTACEEELVDAIRVLRNYGSRKKYHHLLLGENSRLDTLHAAVLRVKLPLLDDYSSRRRSRAARYTEQLQGVGDLVLPHVPDQVTPVFHLFVVQTGHREALAEHLAANDIDTLIHYPVPIHRQPAYSEHGWRDGQFPVTEGLAPRLLSLPIFPELEDDQVDHVCDSIKQFFDSVGVGRSSTPAEVTAG